MPIIGIDYAKEQPPAQGGNVTAHLDTNNGAGLIGRQITEAGNEMADLGMHIAGRLQQAADQTEYNTTMRKYAEQEQAAHTTIATSLDPKANQTVLDKFKSDWQSPTASNPRVQQMVNSELATRLPNTYAQLNLANLKVQRDQIDQQDSVNENHYYAAGDQKTFDALQDSRQLSGLQNSIETTVKKESFANMSAMTKAGILLANNDPQQAELVLKSGDPKTMTPEHLGHFNALLRTIQAAKEEQSQAVQSMIVGDAYKAADLPANQQMQAFDAITKKALSAPMTASERREMLNWIDKQQKGEAGEPDKMLSAQAWNKVYSLDSQSSKADIDATNKFLVDNAKSLPEFVSMSKTVAERKNSANSSAVKSAIDVSGLDSDPVFIQQAHAAMNGQNLGPKEQYSKVSELAAVYKTTNPGKSYKRPGGDEKFNAAVEAMQDGKQIEIRKDLVFHMANPTEAEHYLRRTYGENWAKNEPDLRNNFLVMAEGTYSQLKAAYDPHAGEKDSYDITYTDPYTGEQITENKLVLDKKLQDAHAVWQKVKDQTATSQPTNMPKPTNKAEFDAIPSGVKYIRADGTIGQKQ